MDPLSIIQLAFRFYPTIQAIVQEARSNEDIVTKVQHLAPTFAPILEQIGGQLFPQAKPALHIAAAVVASYSPNTTKWLQAALNDLLTPSPNLAVDGQYGPKTKAAVAQLQQQLGLTVDGWAGTITQAAIQKLLMKL